MKTIKLTDKEIKMIYQALEYANTSGKFCIDWDNESWDINIVDAMSDLFFWLVYGEDKTEYKNIVKDHLANY